MSSVNDDATSHQHPDRKEERCFLSYKPPPEDGTPALVEEFLENAQFISEDLEWLLALPHDKFWCQVWLSKIQKLFMEIWVKWSYKSFEKEKKIC